MKRLERQLLSYKMQTENSAIQIAKADSVINGGY